MTDKEKWTGPDKKTMWAEMFGNEGPEPESPAAESDASSGSSANFSTEKSAELKGQKKNRVQRAATKEVMENAKAPTEGEGEAESREENAAPAESVDQPAEKDTAQAEARELTAEKETAQAEAGELTAEKETAQTEAGEQTAEKDTAQVGAGDPTAEKETAQAEPSLSEEEKKKARWEAAKKNPKKEIFFTREDLAELREISVAEKAESMATVDRKETDSSAEEEAEKASIYQAKTEDQAKDELNSANTEEEKPIFYQKAGNYNTNPQIQSQAQEYQEERKQKKKKKKTGLWLLLLLLLAIFVALAIGKRRRERAVTNGPDENLLASGEESANSMASAEETSPTSESLPSSDAGLTGNETSPEAEGPKAEGIFKGKAQAKADSDTYKQDAHGTGWNHNAAASVYAYKAEAVNNAMFGGQPLDGQQKFAFLTFDDGIQETSTPRLLDILNEEGVPATFFTVGRKVTPETADLVKRILAEGHALAFHSYNHNYTYLYPNGSGSADHVIGDLDKVEKTYQDLFGPDLKIKVWRYPGGHMSWKNMTAADAALKERGVTWVDWDSTNGDAAGNTAPKTIQGQVDEVFKGWAAYGKPNAIVILMHDTPDKQLTRDSIPSIVEALRDEGFVFGVLE